MGEEIQNYNAFTDIEFNPEKSINCQARAAAIYVGIAKAGLLDKTRNFYEFCDLISAKGDAVNTARVVRETKPVSEPAPFAGFSVGQVIKHPLFGEGNIISISGEQLKVQFSCGEKTLIAKWVREKCTF